MSILVDADRRKLWLVEISWYLAGVAHETKNISLRLDPSLAEQLEVVADLEEQTVSDVIRLAIRAHVDQRLRDPALQRLLEQNINRHKQILDQVRRRQRSTRT